MKIFLVVLRSLLICIVMDKISYKMMKMRHWVLTCVADLTTYHLVVFSSSLEAMTKLQKLR